MDVSEAARISSPTQDRLERHHLSPLMRARGATKTGEVAYACPFGCREGKTDENGYCRHLVGFTNHSEKECRAGLGLLEKMVRRGDRRVVQVRRERVPAENVYDDEDGPGYTEGPPVLEPVLPSDTLVRITVSSRVYREAPRKADEPAKKKTS